MIHAAVECARDELLTRGLGDIEARILIDILTCRLDASPHESRQLQMKARVISRIIELWFNGNRAAAHQLAACAGFADHLPRPGMEADDCMETMLLSCL